MADPPPPKRPKVDGAGGDEAAASRRDDAGSGDAVVKEAVGSSTGKEADAGSGDAVAAEAVGSVAAQEVAMPPCPLIPPVAPAASTERRVRREEMMASRASRYGLSPPPPVYGPKDTALWPEEAAELFRATKTNQDSKYASRYMRWWFKNHAGMPGRVPSIPRSAYAMYYVERKGEIFRSAGKFRQKKDGKRIGAEWKALGEEDKRPYAEKFAALQAQREANEEWRHDTMAAWRKERLEKLRAEDVELDPLRRRSDGLEPICECAKCGPASGDAGDGS